MDWQTETKAPLNAGTLQVWLQDGSIRRVKPIQAMIGTVFYFDDCIHQLQNAYCAASLINGWRLASHSGEK